MQSQPAAADRPRAGSGSDDPLSESPTISSSSRARSSVVPFRTREYRSGAFADVVEGSQVREQVEVLNTIPVRTRSCRISSRFSFVRCPPPLIRMPATSIVPAVGSSRKLTHRRSVLLPEPDRPNMTTTSPSRPRDRFAFNTSCPRNDFSEPFDPTRPGGRSSSPSRPGPFRLSPAAAYATPAVPRT